MLSKKLFIVLIMILSTFAIAQRASAACPPAQNSNLVTWTDTLVDCLPAEGTDDFLEPSATDITNFKAAVSALLAEDFTGADTLADVVGYEVFAYTDAGNGNETIYALHPESGNTDSRGYFFVRPQSQVKRNLVLEAPHPADDADTALLAARIFREAGARAFFFAGTDRCANAATTSCVGTTDVCSGGTGAHRISDMAHHEKSFFQAFHEVASQEPDTIAIQLHGFGSGLPGYAFSISDGSVVTRPLSYLTNAVAAEFESRMLTAQPSVSFPGNSCNRAGNLEELCGTESVQGRFTNGTANLCQLNEVFAPEANGRFIHLELSRDLRDAEQSGEADNFDSQLVVDALKAAFPERGAKVADLVWADLNGDGSQDPGEPGLEKVTLQLHPAGQTAVTTESDRDGGYAFRGLAAGDYEAELVLPNGFNRSPEGTGTATDSDFDSAGFTDVLTLATNQRRLDVDGGLVPLATNGQISGRVWNDADGDGRKETGEANLSDVTVLLFSEGGTQLGSTTASAGAFSFSNLLPGKYYLRFDAGTRGLAEPAAGVDTDADPQTGETALITLAPGAMTAANVDAGVVAECFSKTFIAFGNSWKTFSPSSASGIANWNLPGFSETGWSTLTAPLGYNATGMTAVTVPAFPSHTVYFRRNFQVADPALFQYLSLRVLRDDGVIVYVNGIEVFRNNMPRNPIDAGTPALDSASGEVFAKIPASVLTAGTNLVAVELHDRRKEADDTPDGRFNLELIGTICDTCRIQTTEIASQIATFLDQSTTKQNVPQDGDDEIEFDGSSGVQTRGLIKWDLSNPALDGLDLLAVEIEVEVTNTTNDTFPLFRVTRDWNEAQATWNLAKTGSNWGSPGAGSFTSDYANSSLGTLPKSSSTGIFTIPLNQTGILVVKGWIAGTVSNYGLISVAPGSGGGIDISSDDSANPPKLRLIHTVATCTP
jgi:hypothetical protein